MKKKISKFISIGLIGSLAVFAGCSNVSNTNNLEIKDFDTCEKAGGNIAESYPRQCFIDDMGFVEKLDNTIDPIDLENGYGNDKFAPGHILVGFESVKTYESVILEIEKIEGVKLDELIFDQPSLKIAKFNVPEGVEKDLIVKINGILGVEYAELDKIIEIDPITNPNLPVVSEGNERFIVAPFTEKCQGFHPIDQDCLIINGQYFYEKIEGFKFEKGNEYEILVNKYKRFSDEEFQNIADVSQFGYRLVEIISKEKSSKNRNDYFKPIPTEADENYRGEITSIESGIDGYTINLKLDYPIKVGLGSESKEITEIKTTISIPNLGPESEFNFSDVKVGNKLSVTGQAFNMGDEKFLTAKFAFTLFSLDAKSICDENGGEYNQAGKLGAYHCDIPAKDAGKACTSSNQCEGLCLASGVCSVKTVNFGCTPILDNGQNVTICID